MTRVVVLELNEVPFRVLDAYVRRRPESALAHVLERGDQYTSYTEDEIQLDPWISWPTFHRGVRDRQHGILHLGQPLDEADAKYPPVWTSLARAGRKVGVFGSLHTAPLPAEAARDYAFFVPDYFAPDHAVHPRELEAFQALNVTMTRGSARNVSRKLPVSHLARMVKDVPRLGIEPKTLWKGARQLYEEVRDPSLRTRRRNYQTALMSDVFLQLYERHRPDFATFYTNNVAAAMHRYWAALFPEDPTSKALPAPWRQRYADEVIVALDAVDDVLRRLTQLAERDPELRIVLASSMGQGGIPADEVEDFLSIKDLGRFLGRLGLTASEWAYRPAMVPCVGAIVREDARQKLRDALANFSIDGIPMPLDERPLMPMTYDERPGGFFQFYVQMDQYRGPGQVRMGETTLSLDEAGLGFTAHEDRVNCTAQHVPEGSLVVYGGGSWRASVRGRPQCSTLDVVPSLLRTFGVDVPEKLPGSARPLFD